MTHPVQIARWNPETESWVPLARFSTYEEADRRLDHWGEKFPHAWVEIIVGNVV